MEKKATLKKSIKPVRLTVTVTASRINENGTFSSLTIESVKGIDGVYAVSPPVSGGALYFKTDSLTGLTVLEDRAPAAAAPKKLF